ncbi:hypothetical protein [Clostridium sp. chh4-2]|nr:hypothetical protein [Clostridium sp. chh4-2]
MFFNGFGGIVRPESGCGTGRRRSEGPSGPGKEDAARSDSGFAPKNY